MAVQYNTTIDQGANWYLNVTYKDPEGTPINLTGCTAALQMRTSPLARTAVLTLTSEPNGGIVITPLTGELALSATAEQTAAITNGKYSYDLEITVTATGVVTRLIEGTILVSPQTTRTGE